MYSIPFYYLAVPGKGCTKSNQSKFRNYQFLFVFKDMSSIGALSGPFSSNTIFPSWLPKLQFRVLNKHLDLYNVLNDTCPILYSFFTYLLSPQQTCPPSSWRKATSRWLQMPRTTGFHFRNPWVEEFRFYPQAQPHLFLLPAFPVALHSEPRHISDLTCILHGRCLAASSNTTSPFPAFSFCYSSRSPGSALERMQVLQCDPISRN